MQTCVLRLESEEHKTASSSQQTEEIRTTIFRQLIRTSEKGGDA